MSFVQPQEVRKVRSHQLQRSSQIFFGHVCAHSDCGLVIVAPTRPAGLHVNAMLVQLGLHVPQKVGVFSKPDCDIWIQIFQDSCTPAQSFPLPHMREGPHPWVAWLFAKLCEISWHDLIVPGDEGIVDHRRGGRDPTAQMTKVSVGADDDIQAAFMNKVRLVPRVDHKEDNNSEALLHGRLDEVINLGLELQPSELAGDAHSQGSAAAGVLVMMATSTPSAPSFEAWLEAKPELGPWRLLVLFP
mmetsp:Transcript_52907/g.99143  ORF Transcript_52907/g.99143 Transcript_52907/m.99143 type:complete len:244 (-) Transcript_52907:717-1448(-)